jgi:3-oxoacyl-[acyl-carrier protein] reductase
MRTVLVTGGARGIGRAIALDLAGKGHDVAIAYRTAGALVTDTVLEIEKRGVRALAVHADVSDPEAVEMLFARVREGLGAPAVLVHAAGPYQRTDVLKETPAGWRDMLKNNLDSFFYCTRLAIPGMVENKWGRILGFGMANADRAAAVPGVAAHYVAKVGVIALARSLARAVAPHGVTVNTISPGFIASGSAPEEELTRMLKNIPAGYIGTLDDAVGVAAFLVSDAARYVNGANLILSGGWGI